MDFTGFTRRAFIFFIPSKNLVTHAKTKVKILFNWIDYNCCSKLNNCQNAQVLVDIARLKIRIVGDPIDSYYEVMNSRRRSNLFERCLMHAFVLLVEVGAKSTNPGTAFARMRVD